MLRILALTLAVIAVIASGAWALNPGTDVIVAAAGHGPGVGGAFWITDFFGVNTGDATVELSIAWLPRDADNSNPETRAFTVQSGETLALPDIVLDTFGIDGQFGALRVTATGDVVVLTRLYNDQGNAGTLGQGFAGIPTGAAVVAGSSTDMPGLAHNDARRSNFGAIDVSGAGARVRFVLRDLTGAQLGENTYNLRPYEPILASITDLGVDEFDSATLRAEVESGAAVVFGSTIDNLSGDATTLEAWWPLGDEGAPNVDGVYQVSVYDSLDYAAGGELTIANGEIVHILGTYFNYDKLDGSGNSECTVVFPWGGALDPPIPLDEAAAGFTISNDFSTGGRMTWRVVLNATDGVSLDGTIDATGAGFTAGPPDWTGCNGAYPQLTIKGGRE